MTITPTNTTSEHQDVAATLSRPEALSGLYDSIPHPSTTNHDNISNDLSLPRFVVPPCLVISDAPLEATGLSVDMVSRASIALSSLLLGPALLDLAHQQCDTTTTTNDTCTRIYGLQPSSWLTTIAMAGGLVTALSLPLVGALVDHTPHRRTVGVWSGAALTLCKLLECGLLTNRRWIAVSCLQVVTALLFGMHVTVLYAYGSELSSDAKLQTKYQTKWFVVLYASTLLCLGESMILAKILQVPNRIGLAQIALGVSAVHCAWGFTMAWRFLLGDRPALQSLHVHNSLWKSGFLSLAQGFRQLEREAKWLLGASIFGESANAAVISIGTTFLVHVWRIQGMGYVVLIILVCGPCGSKLGEALAVCTNPVRSAQACLASYLITTSVAARLEAQQTPIIFAVTAVWGLCLGWLHPSLTAAFISLRPSGMDAQMMGVFLFCGMGFTWMPPMLFTILNEVGVPISWSLASLNIFFLLAFLCLLAMGNYELAVQKTMSQRIGNVDADDATIGNGASSNGNGQDHDSKMGTKKIVTMELPTIT